MYNNDDSKIAVGKRLKLARVMTGLNRQEFAELAGVGKTSLEYWENARSSPIKLSSAKKLLEALRNTGVICDIEWLMKGQGLAPRTINPNESINEQIFNKDIDFEIPIILKQEISSFLNSNTKSIITSINRGNLEPILEKGDIVGGIWLSPKLLKKNGICIIQIDDELDVRFVKRTSSDDFDISYIHLELPLEKPHKLKNIQLQQVAPIIRVWRNYNYLI